MTGPGATEDLLLEVAGWIRSTRPGDGRGGVTVLTGAGISTESGIPDFRGPHGVWTRNPGAERLATIQVYLSDPEARRRSWQLRMEHPAWRAEPNEGHRAIVELERRGHLHTLVTQNIDGLHLRAGNDPDRVIEVHGSMRDVVCVACDYRAPVQVAFQRVEAGEPDPPCPHCAGVLKTATVFFGQALDPDDVARAEAAAAACQVFLAVGTSLQVYPVALLPQVALENGARLVVLNAEPTPFDRVADAVLRGGAGELLPALVGAL